jgi:DNA gyrase/topoisomerase IV subunit A
VSEAEAAAAREEALRVFDLVLRDPHALLDVVWDARDGDDAEARIAATYGVSRAAASSVTSMQLLRLTEAGRRRLADELAKWRDGLPE